MDKIAQLELEIIKLERRIEGYHRLTLVGAQDTRDMNLPSLLIQLSNLKNMLLDEYRIEALKIRQEG